MIDDADNPRARRPVRRLPALRPVAGPNSAARRGHRVTAASTARWADDLADVLRVEIRGAEQRGLISTWEGEQLLARLVVVLDQAVAPSWAP